MKNWAIYIVVIGGYLIYSMMTSADRDESGNIVSAGTIDAFSLRVGDCFDDSDDYSGEIDTLAGVPCADPHDNEVYAVFDLTVSEFPEGDAMSQMAFDACMNRFNSFVGVDYESSSLDILTLYPTRESWELQGDREVVCAVFEMNAKKLTGSARNTSM